LPGFAHQRCALRAGMRLRPSGIGCGGPAGQHCRPSGAACMECRLPGLAAHRTGAGHLVNRLDLRVSGAMRAGFPGWQHFVGANGLSPIAFGRGCRRRALSTCRSQALLRAGAATGEVPAQAAYIQGSWQGLPPTSPQRMPLASIMAGRGGLRRGLSACRLQPNFVGRSCQRPGFGA
jgi:hypothetical protein